MTSDAVVVPLKRFEVAKDRLRVQRRLDVTSLARDLARAVIEASRPRHVIVVSEDDDVTRFARDLGVEVWSSAAHGLNEAVQGAYDGLAGRFERLLIVHGDLRQPAGLGGFAPEPGVTLVADHHGEGTNVLVVPTSVDFHFAYGPGSRRRHEAEARRLALACHVILDSPWRFDVDEPQDLNDGRWAPRDEDAGT